MFELRHGQQEASAGRRSHGLRAEDTAGESPEAGMSLEEQKGHLGRGAQRAQRSGEG